jgi:hypothetical protein
VSELDHGLHERDFNDLGELDKAGYLYRVILGEFEVEFEHTGVGEAVGHDAIFEVHILASLGNPR